MKGNTEISQNSRPNFCDEDGAAFLVRCPECEKENYVLNVPSGICTWCDYNLNNHKVILSKPKTETP